MQHLVLAEEVVVALRRLALVMMQHRLALCCCVAVAAVSEVALAALREQRVRRSARHSVSMVVCELWPAPCGTNLETAHGFLDLFQSACYAICTHLIGGTDAASQLQPQHTAWCHEQCVLQTVSRR